MKIKVEYTMAEMPNDILDRQKIDNKIIDALKIAGFRWYASGLNINSGIRDISFDTEDNED